MKKKEEFYRDIDIFSRGSTGFSPFIIDILRGIEREFGGVSKEFLSYIEEKFQVEEKELLDTIKMLNIKFMEMVEAKEIKVCLGVHCKARGSQFVYDEFVRILGVDEGEKTSDGKFLLNIQRCFAKCNEGPNVKVGNKFYDDVSVEDVKKIINENK